MTSRQPMTFVEWTMLLVLSVLWGGTFFFVEVALEDMRPLTLVLCRVALAALTLHIVILAIGQRMPAQPGLWVAFAAMGLMNNFVPFTLIFWGQTHISGSLAAILNATTPLWTVLLAHVLTGDERLTGAKTAGVAFGFLGVMVMFGADALGGISNNLLGQSAVLLAALSYAFAGIFGRRFKAVPPMQTAAGQLTASALLMAPLALTFEQPWALPMPGIGVIGAVLALALASTALAYILYFRILATAGATNLLLVTFLIPVSALVLGVGLLGERLSNSDLVGMALIGLGLAAIDGRLLRLWLPAAGHDAD